MEQNPQRSWIQTILVGPGLILHELAHYIASLLVGRRVQEVKLIQRKGKGVQGHVYSRGGYFSYAFTALAPFLLSNALAFILFRDSMALFNEPFGMNLPLAIVLFWLSFSFAYVSFPSNHDITSAKAHLKTEISSTAKRGGLWFFYLLVLYPVYLFIYIMRPVVLFFNASPLFRLLWFFLIAFLASY